ncbi:MAG: HU-CCDC81 and SPOR domain-containing protein [Flavobacteriales bacterium]|nr:HU-CCDC81 and SPOR domain-containing protein [Flavobacteriales bacterium]
MLSAVEKHIIDLLHYHDCVIIPDLGGLVANYTPAFLDEKGEKLCPPYKGFIWNKFLTHNDGLLANEIAKKDQIGYEQAMEQISEFVAGIKSQLKLQKRFEFDQIGFLYLGDNDLLQFEFSGKNFLMNSFGLPVVRMEKLPVLETVEEEIKETKVIQLTPKEVEEDISIIPIASPETIEKVIIKGSRWWIAAALIPIGFYSAWIPMKTDLFQASGNFHYSDLNPFTFDKEKGNYKMVDNISLDIDTLPVISFEALDVYSQKSMSLFDETNSVLSADSTFVDLEVPEVDHVEISENEGEYFVIGGCFSEESNAKVFVEQLNAKGYNAVLVDVNKGLHRVAFGQFVSKEDAKTALSQITASGEYSGWILKK